MGSTIPLLLILSLNTFYTFIALLWVNCQVMTMWGKAQHRFWWTIRVLWEYNGGYQCAFSHSLDALFESVYLMPMKDFVWMQQNIRAGSCWNKKSLFMTRMLQNVMLTLWSLWISNRREMQLIMQGTFHMTGIVSFAGHFWRQVCVFIIKEHSLNTQSPGIVKLARSMWLYTNYCLCSFPMCYISCFYALAEFVPGAIRNEFFNSL